MTDPLHFTQRISAPPQIVHHAFTRPMLIRQWLCDFAFVAPENSFFLVWNDGSRVMGALLQDEPDHLILSWQNASDGALSQVEVAISPAEGGSSVTVTHVNLPDSAREAAEIFWTTALNQLKIALETGSDVRLEQRPMLGIYPSQLDAEKAARLGVPVERGIYIDGVIEGKSAAAAGLKGGDVLVAVDGFPTLSFQNLTSALARLTPGSTVSVEFYRGAEKMTLTVSLSGRDQKAAPSTPSALAEALRAQYAALDAELDAITHDMPEDAMEHAPADGDWSANEVLAHLIFTERWLQMYIWLCASGDDNLVWIDNNPAQRAGILQRYPTGAELVDALKGAQAETVAAVLALPASFVAMKPAFARMSEVLVTMDDHTKEHFEQMRAALAHWRETATAAG